MGIGKNIRKYRGAMKQTDFAEKLGVNATTVSRWENDINNPNSEMIQKIANVLNVDIECLLQQDFTSKTKELNERYLKEDKGMMIYRFNENEVLELPATVEFIPIFERIIAERLKIQHCATNK